MQSKTKQFIRENFLGLSLTMVGVLSLALAAMMYLNHNRYPSFAVAEGQGLKGPDIEALEKQNRAFERIAEAVTPAVVHIGTTKVIRVQESPFFMDPFFRQFFGDMFGPSIPRERRERALGSGVIVSPDGYIVTNHHVIAKATEIEITLPDKRVFKAKVVGADPQTDIAVLKIDGKDLPTVPWGDSSTLKVGAIVMAFGNPFGLNFTVTRGSVSAIERSGLGIEAFEDFIQTDAAINPGNSGGPLVNVRGELVGINTAILSPARGPQGQGAWSGVGLAIPSNFARQIVESLVKTGKVQRGYLGVTLAELDEKLARHFNVTDRQGVLIESVSPGSPADKAGLKAGDVVRALNGKKVESVARFRLAIAGEAPGTEVALSILRDGKPLTIKVALGDRSTMSAQTGPGRAPAEGTLRGLAVQNLTPSLRNRLGIPEEVRGVVIVDVDPDSPAARAGLEPGDVLQSINRRPITSVAEYNRLASEVTGEVLLMVNRRGQSAFVVVAPDSGE